MRFKRRQGLREEDILFLDEIMLDKDAVDFGSPIDEKGNDSCGRQRSFHRMI